MVVPFVYDWYWLQVLVWVTMGPLQWQGVLNFLTGLGIRHTTSSPNYPQCNGFIEGQIQMVKRLMEKATSTGRSFQEALTSLRAQPLGDGLPSLAEILHGRSLITRKATPVDIVAVRQSLVALQVKYTKNHVKARCARAQWALVIGEEIYFLSAKDEWQIGTVTGTRDTRRSYDIVTGEGTLLRRNRSHLKPRSFDNPIISGNLHFRTSKSSQIEIKNILLWGLQHPPKVKYSYNNKNISLSGPQWTQHPPKVKYAFKTVPNIVIRYTRDTAYDPFFQRHWFHWRVPSSPESRPGLQGSQWQVSRPYLWGEQDHTLPNGPSI